MARAPLKVGVVGTGYFARFHLDAWHRIPGVCLAAVADTDTSKAAAAAADVGNPSVFRSLDDMLSSMQLDLVDLATPPVTHAALISKTVAAGIATVCQKPFCTSLSEARETTALAAHAQVPLIVHENFRFEPWHREIKRLLDARRLGEVYNVTFRLRPGDGQGAEAYLGRQPYFQKMPRFLMRETGIHFIDVFRYYFGEIAGVMADLRRLNPVIAGEDAGLVVFTFRSGVRGLFDGNRLVDHIAEDRRLTMGELLIEGSAGTLRLDGFGRIYLRDHGRNDETLHPMTWENRGYGGDCVKLCLEHIANHFLSSTPIENTAQDYLLNLDVEDAIYRSTAEKRYIALR